MIPVLLFGVFCFWLTMKGNDEDSLPAKLIYSTLVGLFGSTFGLLIALFVGLAAPSLQNTEWRHTQTQTLVSMNSGPSPEGSFFLGSGSINGVQHFYYWYEDGAGYRTDSIPSYGDNAIVFEEERTDGLLLTHEEKCDHILTLFTVCEADGVRYEFRVPNGSVVRDFVLE